MELKSTYGMEHMKPMKKVEAVMPSTEAKERA